MTDFKIGDKVRYTGNAIDVLRGVNLEVTSLYSTDMVIVSYNNTNYAVEIKDLIYDMAGTVTTGDITALSAPYNHYYAISLNELPPLQSGIISNPVYKLECHCGTDKLYGPDSAEELHSTWCPKSRKGNK